jgi:long-chain acyl-CoA synthetase
VSRASNQQAEQTHNLSKFLNLSVFGFLQKAATEHPDKPALIHTEGSLSYNQLNTCSDHFAASLAGIGVQKSDRVALYLPNSPEFVTAYFSILKVGAIVTAVNPLLREREVEYQLADSQAGSVVVSDLLLPVVKQVWDKTALKHAVVVGKEAQLPRVFSFEKLLQKAPTTPPHVSINPAEDLAALQYTGGTTGTPKAAMLTHQNLAANAAAFAARIQGKQAQETFLTALPLSHIYGLTTSLNVPVALAATMILLPKFEAKTVLTAIQRHRVSVFCGVPTMYQALLTCPELGRLASLRLCISGASPLPRQVQKQFMDVTGSLLVEGYGLTEASPVTHCGSAGLPMRFGSIGLPLIGTEARIVDTETGTTPLAAGETGELAVRGPQVMKGYWRRPTETAAVLRDGWLLTGDIACIDQDGYYYIVDRKKDLIKYKGYSVYPHELEAFLYGHPAVQLCAVVGKPDSVAGEIPKAYVVFKNGVSATEQELKEFVNAKVAPYKALREIEICQQLPLSSAGKILKRTLRDQEIAKTGQS